MANSHKLVAAADAHAPATHAASHQNGGADEIDVTGLAGLPDLAGHISDASDAHDASAVSFDPTGLDNITATDVQGALEEVDAAITAGPGGGGGLVLLEQHTAASSAALDFTAWYSSLYDEYLIEFVGILPATDDVAFSMLCSTNGGSSYDTSSIYDQAFYYIATGLSGSSGNATDAASADFGGNISNGSTGGLFGSVTLFAPGSTTAHKVMTGLQAFKHSSVGYIQFWRTWVYKSTSAVNALRFSMSSGNIASGIIRVYGLAK